MWQPKIEINTSQKVNTFFLGGFEISLLDIKDIIRFDKWWCYYCGFNCIMMAWPWALIALNISNSHWSYDVDYGVSAFLATLVSFRAYFGTDMFIKLYWTSSWITRTDNDTRDTIGTATCSLKGFILAGTIGAIGAITVSFGVTMGITGRMYKSNPNFITACTFIAMGLGVYNGFLTSVFMALPVSPNFFLTRMGEGLFIRYMHKRNVFNRLCTAVHSNEAMLILFVEDQQGLKVALKGGTDEES